MDWRARPEVRILMRSTWKNPGISVVAQNMVVAAQMENGRWLKRDIWVIEWIKDVVVDWL